MTLFVQQVNFQLFVKNWKQVFFLTPMAIRSINWWIYVKKVEEPKFELLLNGAFNLSVSTDLVL